MPLHCDCTYAHRARYMCTICLHCLIRILFITFYFTFVAIYIYIFYFSIPFLLPAHNSTLIIVVLCCYFFFKCCFCFAVFARCNIFICNRKPHPTLVFVLLTVWNEEKKTFSHLIGFRSLKCTDRCFLVHSNGVYYLRSCNVCCEGFPLALLLSRQNA